jgi:hypothetical protein
MNTLSKSACAICHRSVQEKNRPKNVKVEQVLPYRLACTRLAIQRRDTRCGDATERPDRGFTGKDTIRQRTTGTAPQSPCITIGAR